MWSNAGMANRQGKSPCASRKCPLQLTLRLGWAWQLYWHCLYLRIGCSIILLLLCDSRSISVHQAGGWVRHHCCANAVPVSASLFRLIDRRRAVTSTSAAALHSEHTFVTASRQFSIRNQQLYHDSLFQPHVFSTILQSTLGCHLWAKQRLIEQAREC